VLSPSSGQTSSDASQEGNSTSAFRPTYLTSRYFFLVSERAWHLLLLSVPVNLLLALLPDLHLALTSPAILELGELGLMSGALALLTGGILWALRNPLLDLLFALTHLQQKLAVSALWPVLVLVGIAVVSVLFEVASQFSEINLTSVLVTALVLFGTISSVVQAARQRRTQAVHDANDPTSKIERANALMGWLSVLPMGLVRLGGLALALTLTITNGGVFMLLSATIAEIMILLAMRPLFDDFTFTCPRCGLPSSRAFRAGALCPNCLSQKSDAALLYVNSNAPWALKLSRRAEELSALAEKRLPKALIESSAQQK
jgi:hypothetical protein